MSESREVTQIVGDFTRLAEDSSANKIVLLSEIAVETRADDAHELQVERVIEQTWPYCDRTGSCRISSMSASSET